MRFSSFAPPSPSRAWKRGVCKGQSRFVYIVRSSYHAPSHVWNALLIRVVLMRNHEDPVLVSLHRLLGRECVRRSRRVPSPNSSHSLRRTCLVAGRSSTNTRLGRRAWDHLTHYNSIKHVQLACVECIGALGVRSVYASLIGSRCTQ